MTKTELQTRAGKLLTILAYSRGKNYFAGWQRTFMHCERASIFRALDRMKENRTETETPTYQVPEHINHTIRQVEKIMEKDFEWQEKNRNLSKAA